MKNTFLLHALPEVLEFEGSQFTDNSNDAGGPTRYGITQTDYNVHLKASGLPWQSVEFITMQQVDNIYYNMYWSPIHGDDLPFPIDWITFDAGVNMGIQTAINMLEQAINFPEDSSITPALLNAIKSDCSTLVGTHALKEKELSERLNRYNDIVAQHANDQEFLQGWINRVNILNQVA